MNKSIKDITQTEMLEFLTSSCIKRDTEEKVTFHVNKNGFKVAVLETHYEGGDDPDFTLSDQFVFTGTEIVNDMESQMSGLTALQSEYQQFLLKKGYVFSD